MHPVFYAHPVHSEGYVGHILREDRRQCRPVMLLQYHYQHTCLIKVVNDIYQKDHVLTFATWA